MSNYLTQIELKAINDAVVALNQWYDDHDLISLDNIDVFDTNGESLGKIVFNGDCSAFVYQADLSDN